ncbi:unnamed protein product [Dicrocoelium dendriticum]|nr:unnamed protein product [Dicrocoelium dendriticum]
MAAKTHHPVQTATVISLKYCLVIHQCALMVLACIFIGFSSWLLLWTDEYTLLETVTQTYYYSAGRLLLLVASLCSALLALFGCCIVNLEASASMLTHSICSILLTSMFLGTAACGFNILRELRFVLPKKLHFAMTRYYGINSIIGRNRELTRAIDDIQFNFKCCGIAGDRTSSSSWFIYREQSTWYYLSNMKNSSVELPPFVPDSCCVYEGALNNFQTYEAILNNFGKILNREVCVGLKSLFRNDVLAPIASDPASVTRPNKYLHETGCLTLVYPIYKHYATLLGGLGLGGAVLAIIGLAISCLLLWHIEHERLLQISEKHIPVIENTCSHGASSGLPYTKPTTSAIRTLSEVP